MDFVFCLILIVGIYMFQRDYLISFLNDTNKKFFDFLFIFHLIFFIIYLMYTSTNRSDSGEYYEKTLRVSSWIDCWETGTVFVLFVAYPFIDFLGFSYESMMLLFSFFGFQGMVFFYLAGKENIFNLPMKYAGFTLLELLFFLPNSHFWSSSFGKGSLMTLGIGLFFFGLSRFQKRIIPLLLGAFLVYMIRVHILLAIIMAMGIGSLFSFGNLKWYFKVLIIVVSIGGATFVMDDVLKVSGTETINILDENAGINRRAGELGKSNSGVDISSYSQGFKLFTFLFRPLFFDAPNAMGVVTSVEDVFYLLMAIQIILIGFVQILKWNGFFIISFLTLIIASVALAQVSGNLGIALRQKAQIMPLFFIVYAKVASLRYYKI
jgi:hypothetical protein